MKITYVFEVPYLIRTDSTNIFSISHDGFKSIIEIQNPDGFEYLPWLKGKKSASSGIIFGHTDENFKVNTEKNRSTIKISVKIGRKSLTSFPESEFSIFNWKQEGVEYEILNRILGYLLDKIIECYDRFLEVYTFTTKEIYNSSDIEPIFQKLFPYGIKVYMDEEFIGLYFFAPNTSLIPLRDEEMKTIKEYLKKDVPIDIVEGLLFQSFIAYTRKNYKFSLLTVAQALEIFINQYLINSSKFIIEEKGTSYIFRKRKKGVGTIRKYSDVLKDYKGVSLASYNFNLWDKLDIIVSLRNSIIHRNESRYLESDIHHKLRNVKDYKLDMIIDISSEYPNLFQSAIQIIDWVKQLS